MLRQTKAFKLITLFISLCFIAGVLIPPSYAASLQLPPPNKFINLSNNYTFPVLKGLKFNQSNPFEIEFIIDSASKKEVTKEEASTLIRYFLAALTIPQKDLWVNLSPYEKDRVLTDKLSQTDIGKDLLGQDYILKQLTSSLTYPESQTGKTYWDKIYKDVAKIAGTTNLPIKTFSKVWIVPNEAEVYENKNVVFITKANLKVLTEQDYLAMNSQQKELSVGAPHFAGSITKDINKAALEAMKKVILPKINQDVNNGKNFAQLRQIYHSIILGIWFKKKFQGSVYKHYINQGKIAGIDLKDKNAKEKIYNLYVKAFKKGLYNYIKLNYDPIERRNIKRRYISGGTAFNKFIPKSSSGIYKTPFLGNRFSAHSTIFEHVPEITRKFSSSTIVEADGFIRSDLIFKEIERQIGSQANLFTHETGITPWLKIITEPKEPGIFFFPGFKKRVCEKIGVRVNIKEVFRSEGQQGYFDAIDEAKKDPKFKGILIQIPESGQLAGLSVAETREVINKVPYKYDVDGQNKTSVNKIKQGDAHLYTTVTPQGAMEILKGADVEMKGKRAIFVGNPNSTDYTVTEALLYNAGVDSVDSYNPLDDSKKLNRKKIQDFDIVIVSVNNEKFANDRINAEDLKEGAAVVDVGYTEYPGGVQGDVDIESLRNKGFKFSQSRNGANRVGISILARNTLSAAKHIFGADTSKKMDRKSTEMFEKLFKKKKVKGKIAILFNNDPDKNSGGVQYMTAIQRKANKLGVDLEIKEIQDMTQGEAGTLVKRWNEDGTIDAIIPLTDFPKGITFSVIAGMIIPEKDLDVTNLGPLSNTGTKEEISASNIPDEIISKIKERLGNVKSNISKANVRIISNSKNRWLYLLILKSLHKNTVGFASTEFIDIDLRNKLISDELNENEIRVLIRDNRIVIFDLNGSESITSSHFADNVSKLFEKNLFLDPGKDIALPTTPGAAVAALGTVSEIKGKNIMVIGRKNQALPIIVDAVKQGADRVSIAHTGTSDETMKQMAKEADIIFVAVNVANALTTEMFKPLPIVKTIFHKN